MVEGALSISNVDMLPGTDGNNITSDELTGLDWLDPAATIGLSYSEVTALLATPNYAGFRYATRSEVRDFFNHLGLPLPDFDPESRNSELSFAFSLDGGAAYDTASTYFGTTYIEPGIAAYTMAVTADGSVAGQFTINLFGAMGIYTYDSATFIIDAESVNVEESDLTPDMMGSWLVRATPLMSSVPEANLLAVPEPASLIIWLLLGAGVGFQSWRRNRPSACRRGPSPRSAL